MGENKKKYLAVFEEYEIDEEGKLLNAEEPIEEPVEEPIEEPIE